MSINWNFENDFIGTMTLGYKYNKKDYKTTYNLYDGNALCIELYESENTYNVHGFFADKNHMKNCLGITKGYDNIYNSYSIELDLLSNSKSAKIIAEGFTKAKFDKEVIIKLSNKVNKYINK